MTRKGRCVVVRSTDEKTRYSVRSHARGRAEADPKPVEFVEPAFDAAPMGCYKLQLMLRRRCDDA